VPLYHILESGSRPAGRQTRAVPCGGVVTINSQSKEINPEWTILGFAHYARVIRRGARRFSSVSSAADLQQVAFENPDGQQVLV